MNLIQSANIIQIYKLYPNTTNCYKSNLDNNLDKI